MRIFSPEDLAPPSASCSLTVAIPARDEERLLGKTLEAFARQTTTDGKPLGPGAFDLVLFANNCQDGTAEVARAFADAHPALPTSVVSCDLPESEAHVGMARKLVMDLAAERFIVSGRPRGIVATTDADTLVDDDWVANILLESKGVDAVAGYVTIAESELPTLLAPARLLYARERAYRRVLAEASHAFDPLPFDPAPRHAAFVGAGFAVAADTYIAAGGIPPIPVLEDRTFSEALRRIDARVRHSLRVRARTSARRINRVKGGFGTFVDELHQRGAAGDTFLVEHPRETLEDLALRAALRRIWNGCGDGGDVADLRRCTSILGVSEEEWLPLVDRTAPFGLAYEAVRLRANLRTYDPVPVECATVALRAAIAQEKARSATRMQAASGAG
jgi:hypothetical protein